MLVHFRGSTCVHIVYVVLGVEKKLGSIFYTTSLMSKVGPVTLSLYGSTSLRAAQLQTKSGEEIILGGPTHLLTTRTCGARAPPGPR